MWNLDRVIVLYEVPHLGQYSVDEDMVVYRGIERVVNCATLQDAKKTLGKIILKDREVKVSTLRKQISDLELQSSDIENFKRNKIWD